MSFKDDLKVLFSSAGAPALKVRVSENYLGVQISPSEIVKEGHIALSARSLKDLGLDVGDGVFVKRLITRFSMGLIVDEMSLELDIQRPPDGSTLLGDDPLFAEAGYAMMDSNYFGVGRKFFSPGEQVMLVKPPELSIQ